MANQGRVLLTLVDGDADEEQLQALTQQLNGDLLRETDLKTSMAHGDGAETGFRGDPMEIGKLVVEFLGSSTVAALVNVLSAYLARKPKLSVELKRGNGDVLTITGSETDVKEFEGTVSKVRGFLSE